MLLLMYRSFTASAKEKQSKDLTHKRLSGCGVILHQEVCRLSSQDKTDNRENTYHTGMLGGYCQTLCRRDVVLTMSHPPVPRCTSRCRQQTLLCDSIHNRTVRIVVPHSEGPPQRGDSMGATENIMLKYNGIFGLIL